MIYLEIKSLHVLCVVLSALGFVLRGFWMLADSPYLSRRWVRVVPHVVDTVLLGSAIALALMSAQYPLQQDWLTAKVAGLLVYILCGSMALRRGKTKVQRAGYFIAALLVLAYIISVALARSPYGVFAPFAS